jgi:hypothetical protein
MRNETTVKLPKGEQTADTTSKKYQLKFKQIGKSCLVHLR